jgi:hypothetical protein
MAFQPQGNKQQRLDPQRYTLQQTSLTMEVMMIAQHMKKPIIIKI